MSKDLHDYVRASRQQGHSDEAIEQELKKAGWAPADIASALDRMPKPGAMPQAAGLTMHAKLPGTIPLIKESFQQYGRSWKQYVALTIVPYLFGLPAALYFATKGKDVIAETSSLPDLTTIAIIVASITLVVLTQILFYPALLMAVANEGSLGFGGSFRKGLRFFFPLIWVAILSGAVAYGGMALLVVPGIIASVSVSLAPLVLAREEKRGLQALAESGLLVKEYWWAMVGRMILASLLAWLVIVPVSIVLSLFKLASLQVIYSMAINVLTVPLFLILQYRIFSHLRAIKGAFSDEAVAQRRKRYLILAILGVVLPIVFAAVAGFAVIQFASQLIQDYSDSPSSYTYSDEAATPSSDTVISVLPNDNAMPESTEIINEVKRVQTALELYYANFGEYPINEQVITIGDTDNNVLTEQGFGDESILYGDRYMDLSTLKGTYQYQSSDGSTYTITFTLPDADSGFAVGSHKATPEGIMN